MAATYLVQQFVDDAREILRWPQPLLIRQQAIGERLVELAERDDLVDIATRTGPTGEVTSDTFHLYRDQQHEQPVGLLLVQFDPGFSSSIHGHGHYWVVGTGYRGRDRWDMYERLDDESTPGHADLRPVGEIFIGKGDVAIMPEPPRAIHRHNGVADVPTLELIFSAGIIDLDARLNYDPQAKTCWPSDVSRRGTAALPAYRPAEPHTAPG